MQPIQTRAYGRLFRSRTEARWAVAFTEARIDWHYELEGFHLPHGLYLPDFWLPQVNMWAEVKGQAFTLEELHKAHDLANQTQRSVLLLVGPPANAAYYAIEPDDTVFPWHQQLSDCTQVSVCDYAPFEGSDYHLTERRFFGGCGGYGPFPHPYPYDGDHTHPAISAALSARFEHGEAPALA
jgi:hypothetical protein